MASAVKLVGFVGGEQSKLKSSLKLAKAGSELSKGNVSGAVSSLLKGSDDPLLRFQTYLGLRDAEFDGKIRIKIFGAKDLPDMDGGKGLSLKGSDPYVAIKFDGVEKGKTIVAKDGTHPVWNQIFDIDVKGKVSNIALELYDKDLHTDDYIGHVIVAGKDLLKAKAIEGPKPLQAKVGEQAIGELSFQVEYIPPSFDGKLNISVIKAQNLRNADTFGKSDPYVVILVDDEKVGKTKVVDNNLSPTWNENFLSLVAGQRNAVFFTIWDEDPGKDDSLGYLKIPTSDIVQRGTIEGTFELVPPDNTGKPAGSITIKIVYTPPQLNGKIHVVVKEGIGLANKDNVGFIPGHSDPYVIVQVDGKEVGRTKIAQNTENPKWNEEFTFDVVPDNKAVTFNVLDDDVGDDDSLGFVRLGAQEIAIRKKIEEEFILRGNQGDTSVIGKLSIGLSYTPNAEETDPAIISAAAKIASK